MTQPHLQPLKGLQPTFRQKRFAHFVFLLAYTSVRPIPYPPDPLFKTFIGHAEEMGMSLPVEFSFLVQRKFMYVNRLLAAGKKGRVGMARKGMISVEKGHFFCFFSEKRQELQKIDRILPKSIVAKNHLNFSVFGA